MTERNTIDNGRLLLFVATVRVWFVIEMISLNSPNIHISHYYF